MNAIINKRRIIAVDDHKDILEIIKNCMRDHYEVGCFTSAGAVLDIDPIILRQTDLYIIDVRIHTYRNGTDLAVSLSKLDEHVPFLIISGYDPPIEEIMSMPITNVTDFLAKPFDRFTILNRSKILIMAAESLKVIVEKPDEVRDEWRRILIDHSATFKALLGHNKTPGK
jgi:DNA-binding NtrC family response regulator